MAINPQDRIHGACISEVVLGLSLSIPELRLSVTTGADRSSYLFECVEANSQRTCQFGVYVKYSRKRLSPWSYSYDQDHQVELKNIASMCGEVFSIFINGEDGYACVDYEELRELLDDHFEEVEWVRVQRKLRESYRISGSDGLRDKPLAQNAFPQKIVDYVRRTLDQATTDTEIETVPDWLLKQQNSTEPIVSPSEAGQSQKSSSLRAIFRRLIG
jgi:hypothetical protein